MQPESSNHHLDPKLLEHKAVTIYPGEIEVQKKTPISTLLGSCVAICLYDPYLRIAGMNHYMLPHFRDREKNLQDGVYSGMASMDALVNAMMKHGAHRSRLIAKGFGGGCMNQLDHSPSIGERNIAFAMAWLDAERIPIVAMDWGGHWARKIIFDPHTGDVFSRKIHKLLPQMPELEKAEVNYEAKLKANLTQAKVDFW
jgi:chemotaxis protein CheD